MDEIFGSSMLKVKNRKPNDLTKVKREKKVNIQDFHYRFIHTTQPGRHTLCRYRLEYIRDNFLDDNIPVIIHLKRDGQTGHYIILAGYENGIVYYTNPNDEVCPGGFEEDETDVIHEVPVDEFLSQDWYECGLDPAYWDGKWFIFFHEKPFIR